MGDQLLSTCVLGVRGLDRVLGARTARYGGNTRRSKFGCGDRLLLFARAPHPLSRQTSPDRASTASLFTHTHLTMCAVLPFFGPFFQPQNKFRLWAGHLSGR